MNIINTKSKTPPHLPLRIEHSYVPIFCYPAYIFPNKKNLLKLVSAIYLHMCLLHNICMNRVLHFAILVQTCCISTTPLLFVNKT